MHYKDANPLLPVLVAIPQYTHPPTPALVDAGPLHTPSPCPLAHWGLSLNSKPLCSPSRSVLAAGSQGCTLAWAFSLRGGLALSPNDGHPQSLSPIASANRVRRIKSGTCGSLCGSVVSAKSTTGFDRPISQSVFESSLKNILPFPTSLELRLSLTPEYFPRPHYLPSRTQTLPPFIFRLCPTSAPAPLGRQSGL